MISIVGFSGASIFDLLNFDRELDRAPPVKLCKEGTAVNVANLTQMDLKNCHFLANALLYSEHIRNLY